MDKKIKVSDIKIKTRTLDEFDKYYEEKYGIIKNKDRKREWDMSMVIIPYFHKLPKELIVTKDIEEGTRLWYARDFHNGKKKKFYNFIEINEKYQPPMILAKDEDGIRKLFPIEQVCIVPSASKFKNKKTTEELHNEHKEKKKIVRNENKQKELEKVEKEKELNTEIPTKNIIKKKKTSKTKSVKKKKK